MKSSLSLMCIALGLLVSGCMSSMPNTFEIRSNIAAQVEGADCTQLRENMVAALEAREQAATTAEVGDAARIAGTALSFVPMAGMAGLAMSGGGMVAGSHGATSAREPELLYGESHRAYQQMGCEPAIPYGQ